MRITSLNLLYPPFAHRFLKGLRLAKQAGIPLEPFETYRTFARQAELYAQGRTQPGKIVTRAKPGFSWHHYGMACDIVMRQGNRFDWSNENLYKQAGPYFESVGLVWLGRAQKGKAFELAHFQLPCTQTIHEMARLHGSKGILGVWQELDQQWGDDHVWETEINASIS